MTDETRIALLEKVKNRTIKPRLAIEQLIAGGVYPAFAEEDVFAVVGGCDIITVGKDGKERYLYSGKLVSEVDALMQE